MSKLIGIIRKYPVWTYFILAIVISWGAIVALSSTAATPASQEEADSQLIILYMSMLLGPSIAGLLLTALVSGGQGLRELLSRLLTWRVGGRWYAVAFLTAPIIATLVLLGLSIASPAYVPNIINAEDRGGLIMAGVIAGVMVGTLEEIGWTGFALPRLRVHYKMLSAGLLIGVVWGLWHLPPFLESDSLTYGPALALLIAQLFSWLPAYRLLMVWVYEHTNSLLLAILMHGTLNFTLQILVPPQLDTPQLLMWIVVWAIALWIVVAAVITPWRTEPTSEPTRIRETV